MQTPRTIKPLRPMREMHPVRNAIVLTVLALLLVGCAIVWWDHREAARSITRAVLVWQ